MNRVKKIDCADSSHDNYVIQKIPGSKHPDAVELQLRDLSGDRIAPFSIIRKKVQGGTEENQYEDVTVESVLKHVAETHEVFLQLLRLVPDDSTTEDKKAVDFEDGKSNFLRFLF